MSRVDTVFLFLWVIFFAGGIFTRTVRADKSSTRELNPPPVRTSVQEYHRQEHHQFRKVFPFDGIDWSFLGGPYTPDDMVKNCGGYFPKAKAKLVLSSHGLGGERTRVEIYVYNTVPKTVFTVWLKLAPPLNPLTTRFQGVTALAPTKQIPELASITPDEWLSPLAKTKETKGGLGLKGSKETNGKPGSGVASSAANSFTTNERGRGHFVTYLDFPLVRGSYPYYVLDREILDPVPISPKGFTLRVASHCKDNYVYGLTPGFHEMWFDWVWKT